MSKFAKLALAAAAVMSTAGAHAGAVIDDFTVNQLPSIYDTVTDGIGLYSKATGATTSIIGGVRELYVSKTGDFAGGEGDVGVRAKVSGNSYQFSTDSKTKGIGYIRWDGVDAGTTTNLNFLGDMQFGLAANLLDAGTGFVINVSSADLVSKFAVQVYTSATQYSIAEFTSAGPGLFVIPFVLLNTVASFQGGLVGGGANYMNVNALQVALNSDDAAVTIDLSIENIQVVPEPGTLALAGLALLGLGAARRRKSVK